MPGSDIQNGAVEQRGFWQLILEGVYHLAVFLWFLNPIQLYPDIAQPPRLKKTLTPFLLDFGY